MINCTAIPGKSTETAKVPVCLRIGSDDINDLQLNRRNRPMKKEELKMTAKCTEGSFSLGMGLEPLPKRESFEPSCNSVVDSSRFNPLGAKATIKSESRSALIAIFLFEWLPVRYSTGRGEPEGD